MEVTQEEKKEITQDSGKQRYQAFLDTEYWKITSRRCKQAAGYRCERCGSPYQLQTHHRFYTSDLHDTPLYALEVLCDQCHDIHHSLPSRSKIWRYLKPDEYGLHEFCKAINYLIEYLYHNGRLDDDQLAHLKAIADHVKHPVVKGRLTMLTRLAGSFMQRQLGLRTDIYLGPEHDD